MDLLIAIAITPSVVLLTGVCVGGVETLCDWLNEKEDDCKQRKIEKLFKKEQENLINEREKLWNWYVSAREKV